MPRKRLTREHVIHDLGLNHFERQALLCGFSLERVYHDYGVDAEVFTYNQDGEIENGCIAIQIKATDQIEAASEVLSYSLRIETATLDHWLAEPMPVILVLYDAHSDAAYWMDVQEHIAERGSLMLAAGHRSVTLQIPLTHRVDTEALRALQACKRRLLERRYKVT